MISIIIPVFNRPDEVRELLESLSVASREGDFEVVIVEDGSSNKCDDVVAEFANSLNIKYFFKQNSGPGPSRNYGAERAAGDYFVFLDSDVVVPEGWFKAVERALPADAFGGPDRAAENFTPLQQGINYAMTAPLTTGGIRGGTERSFQPRSFNMCLRREVFEAVGGFANMRFGEDIDLSYRVLEAGFSTKLVADAWVWHKRRTRWRQFFKQVFNSGSARVALSRKHHGTLRAVHVLPTIFAIGAGLLAAVGAFALLCAVIFYGIAYLIGPAYLKIYECLGFDGDGGIVGWILKIPYVFTILAYPLAIFFLWYTKWFWAVYGLWASVIFCDAWVRTRRLRVAFYALGASFVQHTAYGLGFLYGLVRGRSAFEKGFYR